jgi:RNA polymerase-binding transcription factor DksA
MPHARLIARLKARRAELTMDLSKIEDALDDPAPKDWEDRAAERQGDEVLEALGAHDADELRRIDAALARAEAGDYGNCTKCGDAISVNRLESLPETPFCASCAP